MAQTPDHDKPLVVIHGELPPGMSVEVRKLAEPRILTPEETEAAFEPKAIEFG